MKERIYKNVILFMVGFCVYITIETLYRKFSFWQMGVCGGIIIVLLDKINNHISWDIDLTIQGLIGSFLVTGIEFIIGTAWSYFDWIPVMWDYSNVPLNYNGIICVPFMLVWFVLSLLAIFLSDAINYYVFEELPVPYYKVFGRTMIKYKAKKCQL